MYLELIKGNGKITTCNQLGFEKTRILTDYAQNLPRTLAGRTGRWLHMNQSSLRNNWLTTKSSGKLPIVFEESMEYTSN